MTGTRFERQIPFLGHDGQARLHAARVAIVGVGGLGCHVVQQLAYLGATNQAPIDHDRVDFTNLNRLVIAGPSDVGAHKVEVARRFVVTLDPDAMVRSVPEELRSLAAFNAIKTSDYIIGCVDHDGPRFLLNQLAAAYRKPYLDLGSDIGPDRSSYGGRIVFVRPGEGCLACRGLLDQEEIRQWLETEEERRTRARSYGQDAIPGAGGGPSVVSINGVVASLGVTEILKAITGIGTPAPLRVYRGPQSIVNMPNETEPDTKTCRICSEVFGQGDAAGLVGYISHPGHNHGRTQS